MEPQLTLVWRLIFNVDAAVVSVVGEDFPKEYLDLLESKGVNIEGIEIVKVEKLSFGVENTTTI